MLAMETRNQPALLLQWAMRVLDNEELAQQVEVPLKPGAGRNTKVAKQ